MSLHLAAYCSDNEAIRQLVTVNGVHVESNWCSEFPESTALMLARTLDTAQLLISLGANVNAVMSGYTRRSVLHIAVQVGHEDIVQLLLSCGARVNALDHYSLPPLAYATSIAMARLLIGAGSQVEGGAGAASLVAHRFQTCADNRVPLFLLQRGATIRHNEHLKLFYDAAREPLWQLDAGVYNSRFVVLLALFDSAFVQKRVSLRLVRKNSGQRWRENIVAVRRVACLLHVAGADCGRHRYRMPLLPHWLSIARDALDSARVALIKDDAVEIAIGLQSADLAALLLVAIIDAACVLAPRCPMHVKWSLVTRVKHYGAVVVAEQ